MSQWHRYVNLDLCEFFEMTDHGDINDFSEPKRNRTAAKALDVLVMPQNSGDVEGTYDKSSADYGSEIVGRWAGHRIAIVGDTEKTVYQYRGDKYRACDIFEDDDAENITGMIADVLVDMDILT